MAYNSNIPQANNQLSVSQGDLLLNFQAISTYINVNHVDFNGADQGKHKFIQLPAQSAAPATLATEMALYTKNVTGVPQLFLRRSNNGTEINLTTSGAATNGWTRLPSGILLKWGTIATTTFNLLETIAFPVAASIPVFSAIYSCQVTVAAAQTDNQVVIMMGLFTVTDVNVFARKLIGGGGVTPFTFFAIGI